MRVTKLVVAVVRDQDAARILSALVRAGHGATRLASSGGFLRQGNTTILVGTDDERLEETLAVLRELGGTRQTPVQPFAPLDHPLLRRPIEVPAGGGVAFVLDVQRVERF